MNCCDANGTCTQGRDCPARHKPADELQRLQGETRAMRGLLRQCANAQDVARESVDDALMIVASYGPWGADLNDAHRRQIVLADEVHRLRHLYEMAVHGRAEMRAALRQERADLAGSDHRNRAGRHADRAGVLCGEGDGMSALRDAAQQTLEALEPYADIKPRDWKTDREKLWRSYDALRAALAEQPAEQEPVAWEWRWFDTSPYTVTSGQWSEWKRVEPRNSLCTLDDALNEFRAYIANGLRYELRAIYTAPQPAIPPGYKLVPVEPSAFGVLFAVEQAIQNGDCPWQIEQAFHEYEAERKNGITKE